MSALPEQPTHFLEWRQRGWPGSAHEYEFAPRHAYASYLEETLNSTLASTDCVVLTHVRERAVGLDPRAEGMSVELESGATIDGDAVVIGIGLPEPGTTWAPDCLRNSPFFVADPWAPGAINAISGDLAGPAEVLIVGTGLTMVDVVLSVCNTLPGHRVHALSRTGKLPERHARSMTLPTIPAASDWGDDLDSIIEHTTRHLEEVEAATGDWRPAVDGLRPHVAALWARLSEPDRRRFLREYSGSWSRRRHRIPPGSADQLDSLISGDRLTIAASQVASAKPLPSAGLHVGLADGTTREVGWVINCTGPARDITMRADRFIRDLLRYRCRTALASTTTSGMGVATRHGKVLDSTGTAAAPIWVLGALRRGELFESTAIPEIRSQAVSVAEEVLNHVTLRSPAFSSPADAVRRLGVESGASRRPQ